MCPRNARNRWVILIVGLSALCSATWGQGLGPVPSLTVTSVTDSTMTISATDPVLGRNLRGRVNVPQGATLTPDDWTSPPVVFTVSDLPALSLVDVSVTPRNATGELQAGSALQARTTLLGRNLTPNHQRAVQRVARPELWRNLSVETEALTAGQRDAVNALIFRATKTTLQEMASAEVRRAQDELTDIGGL